MEMSPAEETAYPSGSSKKAIYSLVIIKFLELCLIICCIGLIDEPATHSHIRVFITPRVVALCYVTFGSILIYTSIYLIMAMLGDMTPWRSATLWSLVSLVLLISTAVLLFLDWGTTKDRNYWHPNMQRLDLVLTSAIVTVVTAFLFLLDFLVTARLGVTGYLE